MKWPYPVVIYYMKHRSEALFDQQFLRFLRKLIAELLTRYLLAPTINAVNVYTVAHGKSGMIGVFRLESQMLPGSGKFERTGLGSDSKYKEATITAFTYLKANSNRISGTISTTSRDYSIGYQDLQGLGMTTNLALPTLIALCSVALSKPTISNLAVLGEISISGSIIKANELANLLQVCLDSGQKRFCSRSRQQRILFPFHPSLLAASI